MSNNTNPNTEPDHPYVAEPRLVDNPDELRQLYVERNLTLREIAAEHATLEKTAVWEALREYGIISNDDTSECDGEQDDSSPLRPFDHPAIASD